MIRPTPLRFLRNGPPTRRDVLRYGALGTGSLLLACGNPRIQSSDEPHPHGGAADADGGTTAADAGTEPLPPPVDHPEDVPEATSFPLGVASGDVTSSRAVLWTQHVGLPSLRLFVWQMEGEVHYRVGEREVTRGPAGFISVDVEGLASGARYRYAFVEVTDGQIVARSPIGRFRAAPDPSSTQALVIGAVACTKQGRALEPLMHAAGREDLDAFILLGDTSYNDGAKSLVEYRAKWTESQLRPAYRDLKARTSVVATWDDHEVDNGWNPETLPAAQKDAALQAMFEFLPIRRSDAAPQRLWRSLKWGKSAELFVLDSRGERKPSTRTTESAEYLSRAQMDWLKAGLAQSDAVFKIVVSSVPIGAFPFSTFSDGWTKYPAARREILEHVDDNGLEGVVWLSGDFHLGSVGRVSSSGAGQNTLEVLAGPGGQTSNYGYTLLDAPQFDWATGDNNYVALHLDPSRRELRTVFHDGSGAVLFDRAYTL